MLKKKVKLEKAYLDFIERKKHSFCGKLVYALLYFLSLLYGLVVFGRNLLYRRNIFSSYCSPFSFLIGIGNISWAGTGKTSLALSLYRQFSPQFKTAILRRGYGEDENKLIKEKKCFLFSGANRKKLVQGLEKDYKLFILDDAFQYRKLKKDVEIVIMGAREFKRKLRLIPASFFREPLKSIRRADFLIINYKEDIARKDIEAALARFSLEPELYFASYRAVGLSDFAGREYDFQFLQAKKVAAFAAIGYPQGFFNLLTKMNINLTEKIIYPDHYLLSQKEYLALEARLLGLGVETLVVTEKDKHHFPAGKKELAILTLSVKLEIEKEHQLIAKIKEKIIKKINKTKG